MSDFKLGQHEKAIADIAERTERIEALVTDIRLQLAERRGERRVALWAAGAAGGLVSLGLPTLAHFLLLALRVRPA